MEASSSGRRPSRRRVILVILAACLPVIPIVIGVTLITSGQTLASPGTLYRPLSTRAASSGPTVPAAASPSAPGKGALVAIVRHPTTMYASPHGSVVAAQPTHTPFGSPTVLLVRRSVPGWLGVPSPLVGNGRLGWIPASSASLLRISWEIRVSLARRQVTVLHDGKEMQRYTVAIGMPDAPTPTGIFAVTDRLRTGDPSGPYGCCILALSALAPHAIQGWSGGNRIAIHSTTATWTIGQPVSHGCMRLTLAEGRWLINHVPLGTPTIIRSA